MIKNAKQKGNKFEKFIASEIRDSKLDNTAKRQLGSGSGMWKGDINTSLPWTIEAKHQKALQWWASIDQSKREANQSNSNQDNWALVVNDPRKKPEFSDVYIVMDFWRWLDLLKSDQSPKIKEPDRALKYDLEHLRQIANKILKQL